MLLFDRTGSGGQGRGQGKGQGRGNGGGNGAGAGGNCVCPSCGEKTAHSRGVPCVSLNCPKCGTKMTRE